MEHRDWGRIQEIYHSALPLPSAERHAFVANQCRDNPGLANEVYELLSADESSAGFLETPVFEMGLRIMSGSDPDNDLVGTTIDERYLVEKKLEKGGMGQVYLARDLQLPGRLVVIKILLDVWLSNRDALTRFKREVQALTLLDQHPNVVSVYGAGELPDGKPYVVMQYIEGATLRTQIPSEGMDLKRAASILKQIGAALGHIHDKGILHRDLKPENIMLQVLSDGTELLKIVDFGIAKIKDSVVVGTDTEVPMGTLNYMSPEQREGGKLTTASDVYAMAVIACEIITGKRPESSEVLPVRRGPSATAHRIIVRNLSAKPADRYQSARQFGDELQRALVAPAVDRIKWLKVAGVVLVVALLSFGIYTYLNRRTPLPDRKGFNYWLMVQPMRDGREYEDPFKSNGEHPLDSGDKFQLNVYSLESGYLYIFNERPPQPNDITFRMMYPNKETKNASATIGANQTFQSEWMMFSGPPGAENFWIVWSVLPVAELETAKNRALMHPEAGLTDRDVMAVKEFFRTIQADIDVTVRRFQANQHATVRANSDTVLTLAQFKHR